MAIEEYLKVWNARKWMKQTEPFLQTWHAHLGYSLNLFGHFKDGATIEQIALEQDFDDLLLKRWVDVGLAVGHLDQKKGQRIRTKRKMIKYLTKESHQSVGVLLEEMFELHIPTLLSYREKMQKKKDKHIPEMADMVAETSSLLEALTLPKVAAVLKKKKAKTVLDVGCGYGGYLKRLATKFPTISFDGIEVDQDVCSQAIESNTHPNVTIVQGDFHKIEPRNPYEVLMLNNILYYFQSSDRMAMIKRSASLLNKNGVLIIISPLADGKHGKRFASAFNSFMTAHEEMHPLPQKAELMKCGKKAGFRFLEAKPVVKEGGWYMLVFRKK